MAAPKKQKKPPEAVSGAYSAFPHYVADSKAFMGTSHPGKTLLFELMRQHNGSNNGHLQLSHSWLEKRGWNSRDVVQRAKAELIERGLIVLTRKGGRNLGADLFAVSWLKITNFFGLDIQAKDYHLGAWALMDKLPMGEIAKSVPGDGKGSTVRRD